ncbi:hypothetical protein FIBSPDRAFT_883975 [Athelia psychrophila]|uniref:Uncharacterized protein n=1 Tax=Athelia psychrophila TaxID=1759441 RepID=A0A166TQI2_9AGAM|nr:hypothetical protein FIBSPDRAFT_883975 [Fibularhizoctonia sp. CBS 109695]
MKHAKRAGTRAGNTKRGMAGVAQHLHGKDEGARRARHKTQGRRSNQNIPGPKKSNTNSWRLITGARLWHWRTKMVKKWSLNFVTLNYDISAAGGDNIVQNQLRRSDARLYRLRAQEKVLSTQKFKFASNLGLYASLGRRTQHTCLRIPSKILAYLPILFQAPSTEGEHSAELEHGTFSPRGRRLVPSPVGVTKDKERRKGLARVDRVNGQSGKAVGDEGSGESHHWLYTRIRGLSAMLADVYIVIA